MSFTVVPEEPARQLADPGPPEACPHCGRRAFWRNGCYERHRLLPGPCRVPRWRCQSCGRTHSRPPEGVTRQQLTRPWQETLMRLYVLGVVSLRATAASLEVPGCFVSPASLWRDVQRLQAEPPGTRRRSCPEWSCRAKPGCPWRAGPAICAARGRISTGRPISGSGRPAACTRWSPTTTRPSARP